LNANQQHWLQDLRDTLVIGNYGKGTIRNYCMEMRLLFQYYRDKEVEEITGTDIRKYILFIKEVHGVGYAKCKSVAYSCSFFYKNVLNKPYVLPSKLYPRKKFTLPKVMSQQEVKHLLTSITEVRQYAIVSLLYGTGMRIGELCKITFKDIERANKRILIRQAKGHKDRYVLLPDQALRALEQYYRVYKPEVYLFESKQMKHRPLHPRSLQTIVQSAMVKAG